MQSHQAGRAPSSEGSKGTLQKTYSAAALRKTQYDVILCDVRLSESLRPLRAWTEGQDCLVVTTPTVHDLYGRVIRAVLPEKAAFLVLDCNESSKDMTQVERVCRHAHRARMSRTGLLVGIGGGVCTDITTVAAAWLRRGIRHVRVPTTLVGQVDAGIGYKGAINFDGHKSYLGCFHAPYKVLIAPEFLHTVPPERLRDGFAEIVKMGIVRDARLLDLVERHAQRLIGEAFRSRSAKGSDIIWRAVLGMLEELKKNPYEDQTYERAVDFGHTFSPLLESVSGYQLSHGQAVAVDMALSVTISRDLGLAEPAFRDRILALLCSLKLPIHSPLLSPQLCRESLLTAALHRGGRPNLVLPTGAGKYRFLDSADALGRADFASAIHALKAHEASLIDDRRDRRAVDRPHAQQGRATSLGV